jgi:hypothetical protein
MPHSETGNSSFDDHMETNLQDPRLQELADAQADKTGVSKEATRFYAALFCSALDMQAEQGGKR